MTAEGIIRNLNFFIEKIPKGKTLYVGLTYCNEMTEARHKEKILKLNFDLPEIWLFRKAGDEELATAVYKYCLRNGAKECGLTETDFSAEMHYIVMFAGDRKQ